MSSRPSPFQSPTTGTYAPKLKAPASAGPADAVERSDQRAVLGTKAPIPDDSSFRSSKASTDRMERPREVFRRTDFPPGTWEPRAMLATPERSRQENRITPFCGKRPG